MTADQLIKLVDAGFTKEEISKMFGDPEQKAPEKQKEDPEPEKQKEDSEPEKKQKDEPEKKQDPWTEVLSGVVKEIGEIKTLIQSGNTRKEAGAAETQTVEDILASFINPNKGGKENA